MSPAGTGRKKLLVKTPGIKVGRLEVSVGGETTDILQVLKNGQYRLKPNHNSRLSRETDITQRRYADRKEAENYTKELAQKQYPQGEIDIKYITPIQEKLRQRKYKQ